MWRRRRLVERLEPDPRDRIGADPNEATALRLTLATALRQSCGAPAVWQWSAGTRGSRMLETEIVVQRERRTVMVVEATRPAS